MPSILTLSGLGEPSKQALGAGKKCKCVFNRRTKKGVLLCFVGKTKKNRSGWAFTGKCR